MKKAKAEFLKNFVTPAQAGFHESMDFPVLQVGVT